MDHPIKINRYVLAVIWSNLGYIAGLYKDSGGSVGLLCANLALICLWVKKPSSPE